jgi:lysophospholipase L1-like esterase
MPPSGGATGSGGSGIAGGTTGAGGKTGSGGTIALGGSVGVGGTSVTGGTSAAGGTTSKGGTMGTGGITGGGGSSHTGVWKVMPFGDSITGSTCYPQVLSAQLIAGKHTNFQFVGTVTNNQSCGANTPSVKTEGHGGYGVTYLPSTSTRGKCTKQPQGCGSYAELQTWAAEAPDIVLMHFATNDVWDGRATSEILSSFVAVIAEFRKKNPNVIFFVSKIIKLNPSGCGSCLTNVAALAAALTPAWASTNSMPTSPVYIIDHYDCGFDPATDASDGVHPNLTGATKMATASVSAIAASGYF